jgi:hypothetical protein
LNLYNLDLKLDRAYLVGIKNGFEISPGSIESKDPFERK